jgi:hypothetical protein
VAHAHAAAAADKNQAGFAVAIGAGGKFARFAFPQIEAHMGPARRFRRHMMDAATARAGFNQQCRHSDQATLF